MKLYPSYVVEAQVRHRRRVAFGVAGVVLLALVGAAMLVVLESGVAMSAEAPTTDCASDARSPAPACDRATLRPAG
jgi:hypothetical protein